MTQPDEHLPLKPVEFQILVSLQTEDLHGYGIFQRAQERGEGGAVPGLVTLYRALQRMEDRGLVERLSGGTDGASTDERRRIYRITPLGTRVLRLEALRLDSLVRAALEVGSGSGGDDA